MQNDCDFLAEQDNKNVPPAQLDVARVLPL